jgi:hypothetical protein
MYMGYYKKNQKPIFSWVFNKIVISNYKKKFKWLFLIHIRQKYLKGPIVI